LNWDKLRRNVISHDLSKYSKEEFNDYRKCFFSKDYAEKETGDFKTAWRHHYQVEMILDWVAMSIKFNDDPLEYFMNKKSKLQKEFGDKIDYLKVAYILEKIRVEWKLYMDDENYNLFRYLRD